MNYVVSGLGIVLALSIGVGVLEYKHIEKLDTRLGSAETTIKTLTDALTGIQNASKSRNTTDATVRQLAPAELIDGLR